MKKLNILVVDDDPVIRRLLEQRLKKEGYRIDVAEDGYVAEKLLRDKRYDVVLTDLMMPGDIGGIEVLEIAKEVDEKIEVLVITAHSSVNSAIEAMKKGANDYLEKPINFDELFLRLDKIANVQSVLKSARDLRMAMSTTESVASSTIQSLEIEVSRLRETIDSVERLLRSDTIYHEDKIDKALDLIDNLNS